MKTNLMIALAIGFLVSSVFMAIPSMRNGTSDWADLEMPGMVAAYLFWGALSDSVFWGTALAWLVNALAYGLPVFVVLGFFTLVKRVASNKQPA